MPSSEKIISPGVFTNEIDQTFLPAAIGEIGAVIIGPTVKGTFMNPTVVNSFSEFQIKFGEKFESGSANYTFLTSIAARQYLKHGAKLTVVRIPEGAYSFASASVFQSGALNDAGTIYTGSGGGYPFPNLAQKANLNQDSASLRIYTLGEGRVMNSSASLNSHKSKGLLNSGSIDNLRWEIASSNPKKGTFTLLVRRGDDVTKRKQTLETWSNVNLDPNSPNYVAKVIGDQVNTFRGAGTTDVYIQPSGSYPNKSKYIRVEVLKPTPTYLDENGNIRDNTLSASIPQLQSGSFGGGVGGSGYQQVEDDYGHPMKFYSDISNTNAQGLALGRTSSTSSKQRYLDTLALLNNQDEYDFNLLITPGIISKESNHTEIATKAIDICEDRGDAFYVTDPVLYGGGLSAAATQAETRDSNYAAVYWPWVQVADVSLGRNVWVPPSVVIPGIYAFNDKVAHPWFAPAGLNRGGIDVAIQAERKLTHANRDTLYDSNVNPIATFPGQGVVVWGQKTLQKKASALDRINIRRLMIKVKKFIASTSRFLVFEQNNSGTRNRFLNIVNPYLEQVQSNSGLTAFRVVMDASNNTPDLVDRNVLYGQIFIQPTRTAEFIVLDFTLQPTGATFPE